MALSNEQLVEMAPRILAMIQTPGWKDFVAVIADSIAVTQEEAIMDAPENLLYHRGSIAGLKAAVQRPNELLTAVREITGEKSELRLAAARQRRIVE